MLEGILCSQQELNVIKKKYKEKLKLLQDMLTSAQNERDLALKKVNEMLEDNNYDKVKYWREKNNNINIKFFFLYWLYKFKF